MCSGGKDDEVNSQEILLINFLLDIFSESGLTVVKMFHLKYAPKSFSN